jgi:hypothetical protein
MKAPLDECDICAKQAVPLKRSSEKGRRLLDAVRVPYSLIAGEMLSATDPELLLAHLPSAQIEQWPGSRQTR